MAVGREFHLPPKQFLSNVAAGAGAPALQSLQCRNVLFILFIPLRWIGEVGEVNSGGNYGFAEALFFGGKLGSEAAAGLNEDGMSEFGRPGEFLQRFSSQ